MKLLLIVSLCWVLPVASGYIHRELAVLVGHFMLSPHLPVAVGTLELILQVTRLKFCLHLPFAHTKATGVIGSACGPSYVSHFFLSRKRLKPHSLHRHIRGLSYIHGLMYSTIMNMSVYEESWRTAAHISGTGLPFCILKHVWTLEIYTWVNKPLDSKFILPPSEESIVWQ